MITLVPAALAMAEREASSGAALLRAVVLGYDIGARINFALDVHPFYAAGHSTHTFAPTFGAAAAAGALAGLNADQVRWLISYTAQQASGVNCWQRDLDHIEKAFDFGGMAGRNGVTAATMVQTGFTGVDDVFIGPRNFFFTYADKAKPEELTDGLGARYEITLTNIKKWSVGSPIQAPLDCLEAMLAKRKIRADDVERELMIPVDGSFDHYQESVEATLDTSELSAGRHTVFVRAQDADGNWGAVSAVFLEGAATDPRAPRQAGGRVRP